MAHTPDRMAKITTQEGLRRWEDMGVDILGNIFSRVPRCDLFLCVSLVCHSWLSVCRHVLFWGKDMLDLSAIIDAVGFSETVKYFQKQLGPFPSVGFVLFDGKYSLMDGSELNIKMMRLLRRVMEGRDDYGASLDNWRLSIRTILVPLVIDVTDELLLYIAARAPSVESLVLVGSSKPKATHNFVEVSDYWENLKHARKDNDCLTRTVEIISKKCCELSSLEVSCHGLHFKGETAKFIISSLPRIRSLKLEAAYLHLDGVRVILNEDRLMLETFQLSNCFLMRDRGEPIPTTCTVGFFGRPGLERNWRVKAVGDGLDDLRFNNWVDRTLHHCL